MTQRQEIGIAKYTRVHKWLYKNYGKANKCEFCNLPDKKYQWALKRGCKYDFKVDNFIKLCQSCHSKYDMTEETRKKISKTLMGHKNNIGRVVTKEHREKIRNTLSIPIIQISRQGYFIRLWDSGKQATIETGIKNIVFVLKGKRATAGNYRWEYLWQ